MNLLEVALFLLLCSVVLGWVARRSSSWCRTFPGPPSCSAPSSRLPTPWRRRRSCRGSTFRAAWSRSSRARAWSRTPHDSQGAIMHNARLLPLVPRLAGGAAGRVAGQGSHGAGGEPSVIVQPAEAATPLLPASAPTRGAGARGTGRMSAEQTRALRGPVWRPLIASKVGVPPNERPHDEPTGPPAGVPSPPDALRNSPVADAVIEFTTSFLDHGLRLLPPRREVWPAAVPPMAESHPRPHPRSCQLARRGEDRLFGG